jgi:hypothetical protein
MRPYRRASTERPDARARAKTDRKGSRPGATAAVPAIQRQESGRGVDQVEGDELNHIFYASHLSLRDEMGQAKVNQYNRTKFLQEHPVCAYCGDLATTTDHCPPRCFFEQRNWPETYEFPACEACNQEGRRDEQVLSVIARLKLSNDESKIRQNEWRKLFDGVGNNQPEYIKEWLNGASSASLQKRVLRQMLGPNGDTLRRAGWGAMYWGSLTCAAVERFGIKLGKALYYRHNNELFEGDIYI